MHGCHCSKASIVDRGKHGVKTLTVTDKTVTVKVLTPQSTHGFEEYPFDIATIRKLDVLDFHPDVTFLVGENGTGKSTLVEAIALAIGFGPEGGTKNVRFVQPKPYQNFISI